MQAETSKQIALIFLQLASKGESRQAFAKYVGPNFKHHNIYFKGDAETLMLAMEENARKMPNKVFDIKRVLQDGEQVVTHSHVVFNEGDPGIAVVHIFRFENNKIVEMWDLAQPIPANSVNENGAF